MSKLEALFEVSNSKVVELNVLNRAKLKSWVNSVNTISADSFLESNGYINSCYSKLRKEIESGELEEVIEDLIDQEERFKDVVIQDEADIHAVCYSTIIKNIREILDGILEIQKNDQVNSFDIKLIEKKIGELVLFSDNYRMLFNDKVENHFGGMMRVFDNDIQSALDDILQNRKDLHLFMFRNTSNNLNRVRRQLLAEYHDFFSTFE